MRRGGRRCRDEPWRPPLIVGFRARAALVAFGLVLSLVTMEAALRVYDAVKPLPKNARGQLWELHPVFGWLHPPGVEAIYADDAGEYSVVVRINSKGLRDVEHDYAKPAGVYRILLLGDSYMEAVQVPLEQTFARRLEATLARSGRRVEVINAATAEWGTDNELVFLRSEGVRYSPDLVLLAFTTANDVRNNSRDLNLRVPSPQPFKTTFSVREDGTLEQHPSPPPPPGPKPPPWWQHVRVAVFFANRLGFMPLPELPRGLDLPASATAQLSKVPTDMLVYEQPPRPQVEDAWRVTKALLEAMQDETEGQRARFAIFLVNGPWAHDADWWGMMTYDDPVARKTFNPRAPNDTVAAFARTSRLPCFDLFEPFERAKGKGPLYFRADPHWTAAAHREAAEAVASFLIQEDLVPPGLSGSGTRP